MRVYFIILGMALITFLIRYSMFALAHRIEFPPWFKEALRFVPPAILSAIILPSVLIPQGTSIILDFRSPHLLGALAALLVGIRSKNLLAVILSGMGVFWLTQWLITIL